MRTHAPPLKNAGFGIPGHLEGGQGEITVSGGFTDIGEDTFQMRGSHSLTVAFADAVAVEGGGEFINEHSATGWGGLRITPLSLGRGKKKLQSIGIDFALGGGGGIGGIRCNNEYLKKDSPYECPNDEKWDGVAWHERSTYGFYTEFGFGMLFNR